MKVWQGIEKLLQILRINMGIALRMVMRVILREEIANRIKNIRADLRLASREHVIRETVRGCHRTNSRVIFVGEIMIINKCGFLQEALRNKSGLVKMRRFATREYVKHRKNRDRQESGQSPSINQKHLPPEAAAPREARGEGFCDVVCDAEAFWSLRYYPLTHVILPSLSPGFFVQAKLVQPPSYICSLARKVSV